MLGALGDLFGGSDAGSQAAGVQSAALQKGIDLLRRKMDASVQRLGHFFRAGRDQMPALRDAATVDGLDSRLRNIFNSDTFGGLVDERRREMRGQLAAGGLTRSGHAMEQIARLPSDIGLAIEQMLTGRSQSLAGAGQNAAIGQGNFQIGAANSIANLFNQQGQANASGILADEQSKSAGMGNLMKVASTVGSIFFSDPRLKCNVEPVGKIHDLAVYRWDWRPEFAGTIVADCGNVGFMADEVAERYPHHMMEFGGFMAIDYPALLDELEAKH